MCLQPFIAQAIGYAGLSGPSRVRLGSLKRYGLLEEKKICDVQLTDTAMTVLHHPDGSSEQLAGLRIAALTPELFSALQQTYPQSSNDTIRSYLLTKKKDFLTQEQMQ